MITLTAFVVLFGLGFTAVKLASIARRAIRVSAQPSAPSTRSA